MEITVKESELFVPSLSKILNRFYEAVDRVGGLTLEIENNLISRLEIYNDRLAFSLRHIRELI